MVKLVSVAVDIVGRSGGETNMQGIKSGQRCLPGAINGTVAFVHDYHVEITAGVFMYTIDHSLEQADGNLFLLPGHTRLEPITAVLTAKKVLNCLDSLFGKLLPINQKKNTLSPACLN